MSEPTMCGIAEEYTLLEPALEPVLATRCPVCGSASPQLWQYVNKRQTPQRVVMCSHDETIGPEADEDPLSPTGCPLSMPPIGFYQPTRREAIAYWNAWADALVKLREGRP